jgi:hypothetical protein
MTDTEQEQWVEMLGRSDLQRLLIVRDLLRHANEDKMAREDRMICRRWEAVIAKRMRASLYRPLPPLTAQRGIQYVR